MNKQQASNVTVAKLQTPIDIPAMGIGAATTLGGGKTPGVTITTSEHGLLLSKNNLLSMVPWANVKMVSFSEVVLAEVKK